jgi:hypothetical protein
LNILLLVVGVEAQTPVTVVVVVAEVLFLGLPS